MTESTRKETTWGKVEKGDALDLGGKVWVVQKAKAKGKLVKVTVARNGQKPCDCWKSAALAGDQPAPEPTLSFEAKPSCSCMSSFDGEGDGRCEVHSERRLRQGDAEPAGDSTPEPPHSTPIHQDVDHA